MAKILRRYSLACTGLSDLEAISNLACKSLFLACMFKSQKYSLRMVPYLENVDSSLLTNKKDGMVI